MSAPKMSTTTPWITLKLERAMAKQERAMLRAFRREHPDFCRRLRRMSVDELYETQIALYELSGNEYCARLMRESQLRHRLQQKAASNQTGLQAGPSVVAASTATARVEAVTTPDSGEGFDPKPLPLYSPAPQNAPTTSAGRLNVIPKPAPPDPDNVVPLRAYPKAFGVGTGNRRWIGGE